MHSLQVAVGMWGAQDCVRLCCMGCCVGCLGSVCGRAAGCCMGCLGGGWPYVVGLCRKVPWPGARLAPCRRCARVQGAQGRIAACCRVPCLMGRD